MRFSIIVPAYRVEKYFAQCIESILAQEYKSFELILVVDETSDDACEEIADAFAARDERVVKLMCGHNGLGDARNHGMEIAKGDYLIFVDSDDCIGDVRYLKAIAKCIHEKDPDFVITRSKKIMDETGEIVPMSRPWNRDIIREGSFEERMVHVLTSGYFNVSAWAKAVRRSLIEELQLTFKDGHSEDIDWTAHILNATNKIEILNADSYIYRIRMDSLSKDRNMRKLRDVEERLLAWEDCISKEGAYADAQRGCIAYFYYINLGFIPYLPKEDRKEAFAMMKKFKKYAAYANSRKTRPAKMVCTLFGDKIGSYILYQYIKQGVH